MSFIHSSSGVTVGLSIALLLPAQALSSQQLDRCLVGPPSEVAVTLGPAHRLYLEPKALAVAGDTLLLAGWPNYVSVRNGNVWEVVAQDSIFAVLMDGEGRATAIPSPIPASRIRHPRAAHLGAGRWGILFAETSETTTFPDTAPPLRFWFGITDGQRWVALETLPAAAGRISAVEGSNLLVDADTLYFAIPLRTSSFEGVVLFTRIAEGWTATAIESGYASYVSLGRDSQGTVLLGVVTTRADEHVRQDRNSLFLYRRQRDRTWKDEGRIVPGLLTPVHRPRLPVRDGDMLVWDGGSESGRFFAAELLPAGVRSVQALPGRGTQIFSVGRVRRQPLLLLAATGASGTSAKRALLLLEWSAAPRIVAEHPSPFEGPVAVVSSDSAVYVSGPVFRTDPRPTLHSALVRFPLSCSRQQPPR